MRLLPEQKETLLKGVHDFIDSNCIFRCNPEEQYYDGAPRGTIFPDYPRKNNMTWMFMLRRLMHDPMTVTMVSALILDDIISRYEDGSLGPFQLTGLETSSIPMMIALQQYAGRNKIGINSFSIRKERKPYGLFQFIDGMPTSAPVIVLDDTINSGKSLSRCLDVCKYELGLPPAPVAYSIIKFNDEMDAVTWNDHTIDVVSLFSVKDFSMGYDPEKYWLPSDCDKSYNKRPEYN